MTGVELLLLLYETTTTTRLYRDTDEPYAYFLYRGRRGGASFVYHIRAQPARLYSAFQNDSSDFVQLLYPIIVGFEQSGRDGDFTRRSTALSIRYDIYKCSTRDLPCSRAIRIPHKPVEPCRL